MVSYRHKAYLYLLGAAAIWGAAGPVIKHTLQGIDPIPFLAYRFSISAVISLIFFANKIRAGKKFLYMRRHFKMALLYGLLAAPVAIGILFFGLDNSTVLDLTLVGAIGPLIVTAGGAIFFRDRITKKEKMGIAVVLLGVFVNAFIPLFTKDAEIQFSGNLLLLIFLFADSASILVAKRAVKNKIKSANLTSLAFIVGAMVLIPMALVFHQTDKSFMQTITTLPLKYHLGVWYMAVLSGNLAYFLYVRGQRSIESSEAILFNYLQPVFMIPLAVFWLGEKITPHFIIGALIIIAGLYIAERKKKS